MQVGSTPPLVEELSRLLAGTPYRAVGFLGRGGMGELHVVEHEFLGRRFALKRVRAKHAETPGFAERLRLEAQALGRLQHPNVVEVVDTWIAADGLPCIVLELLQGRTLAETLGERERLPVERAVEIARQCLAGLGAAHALGLVHRDIKPENVFLHEDPGFEPVVKLLDFGLVRVLHGSSHPPLAALEQVRTATGALVGSARYMSPEALRREPLDPRSDLYGVGLLLYEMLTGEGPFDYRATPAPPSARVDGVPEELDLVVMRAIEQHPGSRFQTAEAFEHALAAALPPASRSRGSWSPAPSWKGTVRPR